MGLGEVLQYIATGILILISVSVVLMSCRIIIRHLARGFREGMIGELSWYRIVPESRDSSDTSSTVNEQIDAIRAFCGKLTESRPYTNRGVASFIWSKGDDGMVRLYIGLDKSHITAGLSSVRTLAEGLNCRAEEMNHPPKVPTKGLILSHRDGLSPSTVSADPENMGKVATTLSEVDSISGSIIMTVEMMRESEAKRFEYYMTESAVMRGGVGHRYSSDTTNKATIMSGTAVRTSIGAVSKNGSSSNSANLLKMVLGEVGSKGVKTQSVDPVSYYRNRSILWAIPMIGLAVVLGLAGLSLKLVTLVAIGPLIAAVLAIVLPDIMFGRWFRDRLERGEIVVPSYTWFSPRYWLVGMWNAARSDTDGPTIVNPIANPSHPQVITMYASPLAQFITMPNMTEAINVATERVPMRGFSSNHERRSNDDIGLGFSGAGQEVNYNIRDLANGSFVLGAPESGKTNYLQVKFLGAAELSCGNSLGVHITPVWMETKGEGAYKTWSLVRDIPHSTFVDAHNPLSGTRLALEGRRLSEGASVEEVIANCGSLVAGMQYSYGDGIQGSSREALEFSLRIAMLLSEDEIRFLEVDHRLDPAKPNVIELAYYIIGGDESVKLGSKLRALREQIDHDSQDTRIHYLSEAIGTLSPYLDPKNRSAQERRMAPLNKLSELRNAREFWTPSDRKKDVYVNNIPGHFAPIVINMGPYWEPEANKFSTRINEILSRKLTLAMNFMLWTYVQANCSGWQAQGKLCPVFSDEVADIAVDSDNADLPNIVATVSKEGRSRGFSYHCATQNLVQIPERVQHEVLTFRTVVTFMLPNDLDANRIIKNMGHSYYTSANLQKLPQGIAVVVRMKNLSETIDPFTLSVPEASKWMSYVKKYDTKIEAMSAYGEEVYFANQEVHVELEGV